MVSSAPPCRRPSPLLITDHCSLITGCLVAGLEPMQRCVLRFQVAVEAIMKEAIMRNLRTLMLAAFCVSVLCSRDTVEAQAIRPLDPQAAQEYVSDSEKAESGDPDAAYRVGEAFESGRLGGLKDLTKALTFYRLAAENGHQQAVEKVSQIEAELGETKQKPPASSLGH